jgi:hypothetical protein
MFSAPQEHLSGVICLHVKSLNARELPRPLAFLAGSRGGALAPFDSIPYLSVAFQIRLIEIDGVGHPSHDSET